MLSVEKLSGSGFLLILFVSLLFCHSAFADSQVDYRFVINIHYSDQLNKISLESLSDKYLIYSLKFSSDRKVKYRTRLGFFNSRKQAMEVLAKIKQKYPLAWLDTVKKYDLKYQEKWFVTKGIEGGEKSIQNTSLLLSKKESELEMEKARRLVAENKYEDAIKLYTRILSRGHTDYKQDAQEYLGVSREKNGQLAHAKAEYQEYLRLYPEGEGAERVKMRLENILLASAPPRKKLDDTKKNNKTLWDTYGYFTEFYQYDKLKINTTTSERSSSASTLGLFARRRSDSSDIKMQVTGDYLYDLTNSDKSKGRLTSLYVDYANRPKTTSIRLGRQNHTRSGVLGRMDGVWADYQLHPQWKFNIVAGYPVNYFETNKTQTNRQFIGYSLDIGPFNQFWDFNLFKIEQQVDGLTDRDAVGGEIRYVSPAGIFFTLVDYDNYFGELNKLYIVSTMRFDRGATFNLIYDQGKAPYMLTTNALQGQPYTNIADMNKVYSASEIKQIARDRTADMTSTTISGTIPVNKKYSINLDMTVSNISATPDSATVTGTPSTGDEYYYGAQLIGNDVLSKNDTMLFGIRYTDGSTYERSSYTVSERLRMNEKWRSNFLLYFELTDQSNGAKTTAIKPSAGIDYLYTKSLRLEANLLYDRSSTDGDTLPTENEGVSFTAGLIYDF